MDFTGNNDTLLLEVEAQDTERMLCQVSLAGLLPPGVIAALRCRATLRVVLLLYLWPMSVTVSAAATDKLGAAGMSARPGWFIRHWSPVVMSWEILVAGLGVKPSPRLYESRDLIVCPTCVEC